MMTNHSCCTCVGRLETEKEHQIVYQNDDTNNTHILSVMCLTIYDNNLLHSNKRYVLTTNPHSTYFLKKFAQCFFTYLLLPVKYTIHSKTSPMCILFQGSNKHSLLQAQLLCSNFKHANFHDHKPTGCRHLHAMRRTWPSSINLVYTTELVSVGCLGWRWATLF